MKMSLALSNMVLVDDKLSKTDKDYISKKASKVYHEGYTAKKGKQAVAIAYSYLRRGKKK